jgi:hypothetical protein
MIEGGEKTSSLVVFGYHNAWERTKIMNARDHHMPVWFPEPSWIDDTYAWRGEATTDWLRRSTVPRARECRRFLNENFSKLPGEYQAVLHHVLHIRWPSAFFELIVARTLQVLGADIEVEPASEAGTRIDFLAHFSDSTVSVEAVAPVFDADAGETAKRQSALLDIIESLAPPSWRIMVVELPDLGPSDSRRQFKKTIKELLDTVPPEVGAEPMDLLSELPSGEMHLRVLPERGPGDVGGPVVVAHPALAVLDNSEEKIRKAVKRKRRQGRNVDTPAILAVHATGISSEFPDFDLALYGREVGFFDTYARQITKSEFQADGMFNRSGNDPTFAAVLAFVNVNFPGGPDPVLYLNPRFRGTLPESLLGIETRSYESEKKTVIVEPSRRAGFLGQLGFVSM